MNHFEIPPKAVIIYLLSFLGLKDLTRFTRNINHWFQVNFNVEECYAPTVITTKELDQQVYVRMFSNFTKLKVAKWSKSLKVLQWPMIISNSTTSCLIKNALCSIIPYTIPRLDLQFNHHSEIEYLKVMTRAISVHCVAIQDLYIELLGCSSNRELRKALGLIQTLCVRIPQIHTLTVQNKTSMPSNYSWSLARMIVGHSAMPSSNVQHVRLRGFHTNEVFVQPWPPLTFWSQLLSFEYLSPVLKDTVTLERESMNLPFSIQYVNGLQIPLDNLSQLILEPVQQQ